MCAGRDSKGVLGVGLGLDHAGLLVLVLVSASLVLVSVSACLVLVSDSLVLITSLVLSLHLKPRNVSQYTTESGKLFQTKGPAQEKRRPAVNVLVLGTSTVGDRLTEASSRCFWERKVDSTGIVVWK